MNADLIQQLQEAIKTYDVDSAKEVARKVLESKMDPYEAIVKGLTPAISEVGEAFERNEVFLPQLMMAGDAMIAAIDILKAEIGSEQLNAARKGKVVLGTIRGDVHNIGKNIVGIMLTSNGYDVIDLGIDVEPSKFVEEAEKSNADIIGVSALMTFTAQNMKVVAEYLEMEKARDKHRLIFGGGPLNEKWAKEMGADAYAPDAIKAVAVVNKLMGE